MTTAALKALSYLMLLMAGSALYYKKDLALVCAFCALGFLSETVGRLTKGGAGCEREAGK